MGCYDIVKYYERCDNCCNLISLWQSKSGDCLLRRVSAAELMRQDDLLQIELHVFCNSCGNYNSILVDKNVARMQKFMIEVLTEEEKPNDGDV